MCNKNPSKWSLRLILSGIAAVAAIIAVYLGLYEWHLIDEVWDPVFDQGTANVLRSDLSHEISDWILIPDAILGGLAYLGDIIFALSGSNTRWYDRPWVVFLFGLNVIPLGVVSCILVALQGLVVGSYCFLCLVSATISLILIFFAYDEVYSTLKFLRGVWKKKRKFSLLWDAFFGKPSEEAYETVCEILKKRHGG